MVADLHAFSGQRKFLEPYIRHVVALSIASGIDTSKSTILLQSNFPEILELHWILSSFISPERLCKLSQFRNRTLDVKNKNISTMLYPLLMASDILLFKACHVIAGPDQIIHLNLTRKIAKVLNNAIGSDLMQLPELLSFDTFRVKSLSDGNSKMSKSDGCIMNRISMLDSDDVIHRKVKAAKTETQSENGQHSPEVTNLLNIYSFFSNKTTEQILSEHSSTQLSLMKEKMAEAVIDRLKPIRDKYFEIIEDKNYLHNILKLGRERLKPSVSLVLNELKYLLGHFGTKCPR
ncbi:tryptophanyl-tRNA synthetase, putative [Theileria equi strain WA]|uniref:tryptophan--tRNA ligase n=1 Tax=Theileria equi strain WA TaxID=1537102 RepID=L0B3C1_THEEQ|nr:tryptophanyl-tRNA synthetase, putative [Theileria equi strain WA]AFZ81619.1 tryptophanyl-tRNA synthetase, putative [Theileria equi strain WA]|eukprot:XP_004831285.1 tryptophanyl-tRNA synthetase, putative [Theileria equi strain WA]